MQKNRDEESPFTIIYNCRANSKKRRKKIHKTIESAVQTRSMCRVLIKDQEQENPQSQKLEDLKVKSNIEEPRELEDSLLRPYPTQVQIFDVLVLGTSQFPTF